MPPQFCYCSQKQEKSGASGTERSSELIQLHLQLQTKKILTVLLTGQENPRVKHIYVSPSYTTKVRKDKQNRQLVRIYPSLIYLVLKFHPK